MAKTKKTATGKESAAAPELPLFYKKVVPLHTASHSELYIEPVENYLHTEGTNSVYIAAVEFLKASHEYPIVFAMGNDNIVFPVVLLGLEQQSNLFINKKGEWLADYIPAYVRRYPFILAMGADDNFTVCIDEGYPGFNTAKEGMPLFDEQGAQQKILSQAVDFLQDYQKHVQLTSLFCENLKKLNLLEPMEASIEYGTGKKQKLGGFMGVSRERLKTLEPARLAELVQSDQMELIFAHLASLENISTLMKRAGK